MPPSDNAATVLASRLIRDPVYQQLNQLLQELVQNGEFKPGQQFLTERDVSQRFGVSRVTANKALSHLVVEGLLEFRKGVGTFVREGVLDCDLQSLMSFTRKALLAGRHPETRVLHFDTLEASDAGQEIQEALQLGPDGRLFYFERLRLADGEPLSLERRHVNAASCPGLTRGQVKGSLYALFAQNYGMRVTAAEQAIQAVSLSDQEASQLRVPKGSAALRLRAVGYTGSPLWLEDTLYRGDRYEFHNAVGGARRPRPANLVICGPTWRTSLHQERNAQSSKKGQTKDGGRRPLRTSPELDATA
jgi:GntR family transcriptional regulator